MMSISPSARQPKRLPWSRERLHRERAFALGHAIDLRTRITYSSHLQSYLTFCKLHDFLIDPTPDTLSFYIVYMSHHIKPESVNSYLSGICHELENLFPHVRQTRRSQLVSRTLQGCLKLYNSPTNRKRPLTIDDILCLITAYPLHSHDNKLFMAIVMCGFFALHRLGELTISDDHRLQESRKIIARSSAHCSTHTFGYMLPAHKADRIFEGSAILIPSSHEDVNPQPFFQAYLQSRDHRFPFHPQLFLTSTGASPTRNWFLSRLHTHIFDNVAGHSLRAGGATYFASIGWPDDRIQSLGRWKSNNFHIYIRKNPVVLQALLHARRTPNPPNSPSTPRV